jgi:outer membrane receptor for Fe3+-dicitrate
VAMELDSSVVEPIPACHGVVIEHQKHWMIVPGIRLVSFDSTRSPWSVAKGSSASGHESRS